MKIEREITREAFSTKIDIQLKAKLIQLSAVTRIPQSRLVDEAIEDLLTKYNIVLDHDRE